MSNLQILLIEDNKETLTELLDTLPQTIDRLSIVWEPCSNFEEAQSKIARNRYDLIVTDIYIDARGQKRSFSI